jgi:hypothetical protein
VGEDEVLWGGVLLGAGGKSFFIAAPRERGPSRKSWSAGEREERGFRCGWSAGQGSPEFARILAGGGVGEREGRRRWERGRSRWSGSG